MVSTRGPIGNRAHRQTEERIQEAESANDAEINLMANSLGLEEENDRLLNRVETRHGAHALTMGVHDKA